MVIHLSPCEEKIVVEWWKSKQQSKCHEMHKRFIEIVVNEFIDFLETLAVSVTQCGKQRQCSKSPSYHNRNFNVRYDHWMYQNSGENSI